MMTRREEVLIGLVLDMSASMGSVRDATISAFNEYLKSFKDNPDIDAEVALTVFNSKNFDFRGVKPVSKVKDLSYANYIPDGNTPLYDAIARTISQVDDIGKLYDQVLFVIVTDGQENASREYSLSQINKIISEHEKQQYWDFVYLGANQDAFAVGTSMGIPGGYTHTYQSTPQGTQQAGVLLANSTQAYIKSRSSGQSVASFFVPEGSKAEAKKKKIKAASKKK